jgi:hypothetical protein
MRAARRRARLLPGTILKRAESGAELFVSGQSVSAPMFLPPVGSRPAESPRAARWPLVQE